MKTWLKGGLWGLGINLGLIILYLILSQGGAISYDNPISIIYAPAFLITDLIYWGRNSFAAVIIVSSISYFAVGALIGWIIQKIKKN